MNTATLPPRKKRYRAPNPLSMRTRRRILAGPRDRALAGDVEAVEVLVKLSRDDEARKRAETKE